MRLNISMKRSCGTKGFRRELHKQVSCCRGTLLLIELELLIITGFSDSHKSSAHQNFHSFQVYVPSL